MGMTKLHRKIRLERDAYSESNNPCSITICTQNRRRIFNDKSFATYCIELIKELSIKRSFRLFAYCFMPDHIHLLLQGNGTYSIIDLIREFKSKSTIQSREFGLSGKIYQTSFYDHFLRKDEDIEKHTRYILENPVRKGIVKSMAEYSFSGSEVFDFKR
ncbi:hypothetical protein CEE37_10015 [candidate division LCP-89 bacterium B3_LCP]|uniref:Transposase IS200-like domain-containing protein n=1 Tax=candidate division LCP-89 bacterium B3_LCP TaxID=2012998 RepID=A0A532UYM2_UNCL8|nr:MAG: hypothetical protein CEE37_10015 [candidate division LCP-89 bacterium B3_LCP]